ncbi:spore germination lipoprotein GerD [Paenibacillus motobuensis]|uniref:spore germination lipoprotein GerD n=1 Tax=Paenibacillus TaxID=44249 RepID=UPI00203F7ACB|nr:MULTISPECIES: spore germination lipoprotein GerD [Paenibacillus]MCM3043041.1 spore germination lipoprotein GerD [Paenibacillus lutimineralis]MCM3650145.1 spore germination lipoprotein GerD [Paenibacillus motobuensis]
MKWVGYYRWSLCIILTLTLTACGSDQGSSQSSQGGYKDTKSMVIDILKTDDGKKAIYEALSSPQGESGSSSGSSTDSGSGGSDSGSGSDSGGSSGSSGSSGGSSSGSGGGGYRIKMLLPTNTSEEVKMAVKDTITSPAYKKEIEKIMTDPKFAGNFAKAISAQNKQLHMDLIKDPTYQKSMQDMMKSPEIMQMFLDLTKQSDYRKQTMTIMQEAMQSPIFKMEVMELLKTVVQEQLIPKVEKTAENKGGENQGGKSGGEQKKQGGGGSGSSSSEES